MIQIKNPMWTTLMAKKQLTETQENQIIDKIRKLFYNLSITADMEVIKDGKNSNN